MALFYTTEGSVRWAGSALQLDRIGSNVQDVGFGSRQNYSVKEEIRAYWSKRAETFDQSPGHRIRTSKEKSAWVEVMVEGLGPGEGRKVLELAFGTGEVTGVLLEAGYEVTGLDLSEAMLFRAKAKHAGKSNARLFLGDAEETREPDSHYDAVASRHLVWTLTDPDRAFMEWRRVLKPGGRVIVIDGDWVTAGAIDRLKRRLAVLWDALRGTKPKWDADWHARIMGDLPFRDGLRFDDLKRRMLEAGFIEPRTIDLSLVHRHQRRGATWREWLTLSTYRRGSFALVMRKPLAGENGAQ